MMKSTLTMSLIAMLLAALPGQLISQPEVEWQRSYGGVDRDVCNDLIQTSDGGYMLVGFDMSFGIVRNDAWAVKTDEDGDSLWSREYGGEEGSFFYTVIQTEDGGYLFAGYSREFEDVELRLLKTDEDGEEDWSETYDLAFRFKSVKETEDGYLILGSRNVGEINRNGELQWSHEITGEAVRYCTSIIETADGGYAMIGRTNDLDAQRYDGILVKINDEFETEWYQLHGGRQDDYLFDLVQTEDGGYAMIGSTLSFDRIGLDGWLVRTDENGEFRGQSFFSSNSSVWLKHIMTTEDGGLILAGAYSSWACIYRTDSEGEELWNVAVGNGDWNSGEGYSIIRTEDCGFALGGICWSRHQREDFLLVKLSPDPLLGAPGWHTLPDAAFVEDSSLELDVAFLYEHIQDPDDENEDLEISVEDGEYISAELSEEHLTITSDENWWGRDSLRLTVTDPDDHIASTYLRITVHPINDPPRHFRLVHPENDSELNSNQVAFLWDVAAQNEYETDEVLYSIRFFSGEQSYEVRDIEWIPNDEHLVLYFVPDINDLLDYLGIEEAEDDIEVVWLVAAYDDSSSTECDEPFIFTIPSQGIGGPNNELHPLGFVLHPPFPNPFNTVTSIEYSVDREISVSLLIYNHSGRLVTTLFEGVTAPGHFTVDWDASSASAGIYFVRLTDCQGRAETSKLMLVK